MAQKSGFFNALQIEGDYDRKYNANDYCDNLAVVISNGVLRSIADDLKVTASGMVLTVAPGRAWINGHYYYNDSAFSFNAVVAPIGGSRYDRVVLRLNSELATRSVELVYLQGTASNNPVRPAITRTNTIYDLVLADIYVNTNATSLVITDKRGDASVCGWVYSVSGDQSFIRSLDTSFNEWFAGARDTLASVTLFKRYVDVITTTQLTTSVTFNIPQFDADTCFIEIYVNGILDREFTRNNNIITFDGAGLVAGTVVTVYCYKSIDGTGIMTVADEITELQNKYAALNGISKFTYNCTGLNDNIAISQIAQAIYDGSYTAGTLSTAAEKFLNALGGNAYLATIPNDGQITIDVTGVCGATTPFAGDGTASNRYKWFSIGSTGTNTKRVFFDFGKCDKIDITGGANTNNIIFFGSELHIKNAKLFAHASAANCVFTVALGNSVWGRVEFDNCYFHVVTTGKAVIAENGDFINCYLHVKSNGDNAFCIDAKSDALIRVIGGTLFAYTGTTAKISSVFNVESSETNAVIMAQNINAPIVSQASYYQNYLCRSNAGMTQIFGVVGTLSSSGNAAYRSITGQIQKNKH